MEMASEAAAGTRWTQLSLAYEQLEYMPAEILEHIASQVHMLDLSYNCFKNLAFLRHFTALQTLILDRNSNLDYTTLPKMSTLNVLWLNNCNIVNNSDWLAMLKRQCPNLRQLSMMCNPVGRTVLNGVTAAEETAYREQVHQMLPTLTHFDGVATNVRQRNCHKQQRSYLSLSLRPLLSSAGSLETLTKALLSLTVKQVAST